MSKSRLAIVGTGIAGLSCGYFLRNQFDLTFFEQADYAGGHTNTIDVRTSRETATFDTGFMVFNRVTYPLLCRLFEELKVPVKPTSMSFGVQHLPTGLEFCGSGWNTLFAQRRNLFSIRFWNLLRAIHRFNQEAVAALEDPRWAETPLGEYVARRRYGQDFLNLYLVPMSSAVWSTPPDEMLAFPATTLLRFFHNHGFLGLHTQHPWWTVDGGSREYVRRLWPLLGDRIRLNKPVRAVVRPATGGVEIVTATGRRETFDRAVLACHADQALRLLSEPEPDERRLLQEFRYQRNQATVHTDTSLMPRSKRAWASWNYRVTRNEPGHTSTVYWMNSLQGVSRTTQYFVSINGEEDMRSDSVIRRIDYEHPLFSLGAIRAQKELPALNRRPETRIHFAGSYFRYGFHEDALGAGLDCARSIAGETLWT